MGSYIWFETKKRLMGDRSYSICSNGNNDSGFSNYKFDCTEEQLFTSDRCVF
jgi:hypothetical protein